MRREDMVWVVADGRRCGRVASLVYPAWVRPKQTQSFHLRPSRGVHAGTVTAMELTTTVDARRTTVSVHGDIDSDTAPKLKSELSRLVSAGCPELVLDPAGVSFLSSAGLSVLITTHRTAKSFRLERGNRMVDRLITLTGLEMLYGDAPDAAHPS